MTKMGPHIFCFEVLCSHRKYSYIFPLSGSKTAEGQAEAIPEEGKKNMMASFTNLISKLKVHYEVIDLSMFMNNPVYL